MPNQNDRYFNGEPLSYGLAGFTIIDPGQSVTGTFFCLQPFEGPVKILSATSVWGGSLDNRTIKVSVFGYFTGVTVSSASSYSLLAYNS